MVKSAKQRISASGRRAMAIEFISAGKVHSQTDLVDLLADAGVKVTQATASRDLDEVGAIRAKTASGAMTYRFLESDAQPLSRVTRVSDQLILSVVGSGNLAVVRTPPGGANLLASAIDRATLSGELTAAIGTIAGDDTVLVVAKQANGGPALAAVLKEFAASARKSKSSNIRKTKARKRK